MEVTHFIPIKKATRGAPLRRSASEVGDDTDAPELAFRPFFHAQCRGAKRHGARDVR